MEISRTLLALVLLLWAGIAGATVRADVQPRRISFGNTATLTLEADAVNVVPDLAPLNGNFVVRGQSSSVQTSIINGQQSARTTYIVEIEPRSEGVLTIPAIPFGSESSEPLVLEVTPAQQGSAARGDPYWIDAELGSTSPYVQQAVSYTVRLYYSVPISDGKLDAEAPANASLRQLGEDRQWQEEIDGRRHGVVERRYLLIPERSGALELAPARFRGSAQVSGGGGFFGRVQSISAVGPRLRLDVRAQPDGAPQPWIVVRSLGLARAALPAGARVGEPLLLELTLSADGALSDQLPDLELPAIADAQVFPEAMQRTDSVVEGQPVAVLKRRFAIVPAREGRLNLPEVRVPYWNLDQDRADAAVLAPASLEIAAAAVAMAPMPAVPAVADGAVRVPDRHVDDAVPWRWVSVWLTCALLAALVWGWRRGQPPPRSTAPPARTLDLMPLRRALDGGDLVEIADALRHCCEPPALNLGVLLDLIDDPAQDEALRALQRLRWAGAGEHASVRAQLRATFRNGPRLRKVGMMAKSQVLPPLYPAR
ncbi:MAG: BatD family protein [Xanthomonadales bacterium]|nr:hypothetical protein [Xanthomonadales bacterium]MCC6594590.1 BatD family protein [Xanthomonadales bacterium]MCE7932302.1 protein BatD [Xanthomonadales bacterium PRO6]